MNSKGLKHYILPLDQPVVNLDCTEAFNGLTDKEKLYAYHLSQAAWTGGLIVLVQVPEFTCSTALTRLSTCIQLDLIGT